MKRSETLSARLLEFLSAPDYRPLKQHELAKALELRGSERHDLRHTLKELERRGEIACIRKNRWALPLPTQNLRARLSFLPNGAAIAVIGDAAGTEFFVQRESLAGAIHGDVVQIAPARSRSAAREHKRSEARVVRVLERELRVVVGLLKKGRDYWYVIPDQPRITQNVHVASIVEGVDPVDGHKAAVRLDAWHGPAGALAGSLVEVLGAADAAGIEKRCLLREYGMDEGFEIRIEQAARQRSPELDVRDLEGRTDLRGLHAITIDPEDARDFDDAVSIEPRKDGGWSIGVHIADVAHFVPRDSAIDREALYRGNSVYLVGGFVPMLPKHLTSDVCSLKPNVDRLTHSVLLETDERLRIVKRTTCRSVIHSRRRFTYDEVQAFLDGKPGAGVTPELGAILRNMDEVARELRARRMAAGSLDFSLPEVKCELDETGAPVSITRRGAPEAYHLIEEFMLLANVVVAEVLSQRGVPVLYRIHEEPSDEQWDKMAADLGNLGVIARVRSPQEINAVCRKLAGLPIAYPASIAVLRNLKRAVYSAESVGHFGLGFPKYAHFTSPIRRYPDLVVHRQLGAVEDRRTIPYTAKDLAHMAQHCSDTERRADEAEDESLQITRIRYFQMKVEKGAIGPYKALLTSVTTRGAWVEEAETLQRGLIPLQMLPDDYYEPDPARGVIRGRRRRLEFRVGQVLDVEIARVDSSRRLIDFRVLAAPPAAPARPSFHAPEPRQRGPKRRHRMR